MYHSRFGTLNNHRFRSTFVEEVANPSGSASNKVDGDLGFLASPLDENDDDDLSDVEVVDKADPKIHRRRVWTERGGGNSTLARSAKSTSVRSSNKQQSHI